MKGTAIIAAAVLAAASSVSAQDAAPPVEARRAEAPRAEAPRRDQVRMMESMLTVAVRNGAENLARVMQTREPGSLIVTGTARARGFVLDGFGVFFDVDVPMMKQSVVWSMQTLLREQRRQDLRTFVANAPDGPARRLAELQLRQLDRGGTMPGAVPLPNAAAQAAPSGVAMAQTVDETPAPATTAAAPAPLPELVDPNEQYTEAVKSALKDAMLDYSGLPIGPDEWLMVAARDSEGPSTPGGLDDASTIVLKVRGSDLLAFRSNKLSRDEARKKIEVREF